MYLGEGNDSPLQCSCLENPIDRRAWWATFHGVTKSQTGLDDLHFSLLLFLGIVQSSSLFEIKKERKKEKKKGNENFRTLKDLKNHLFQSPHLCPDNKTPARKCYLRSLIKCSSQATNPPAFIVHILCATYD